MGRFVYIFIDSWGDMGVKFECWVVAWRYDMIEMIIDSIRVSLMNYQRVVILKEKVADRYLPIWIGPAEADAIAVKLQDVSVPRPLTHDLLRSVIDTLGASIDSIIVCDLKNDTFYAKIILNVDGKQMEVDSRPSDALALAVRVGVPIFAEDVVLDKAGIFLDKETGKPVSQKESEKGGEVSEDEMRRMSAFYDFINTLDLDDFDKRKS
jgi:bifunctional DNase/RNase